MPRLEAEGGNLQKNGSKRGLIGNCLGYAPFSPQFPCCRRCPGSPPHPPSLQGLRFPRSPIPAVQISGHSEPSLPPSSAAHSRWPNFQSPSAQSLTRANAAATRTANLPPALLHRVHTALRLGPGRAGVPPRCAGARVATPLACPCVPLATRYTTASPATRAMCFGKAGARGWDRGIQGRGSQEEWGGWRARGCGPCLPRGSVWYLFSIGLCPVSASPQPTRPQSAPLDPGAFLMWSFCSFLIFRVAG